MYADSPDAGRKNLLLVRYSGVFAGVNSGCFTRLAVGGFDYIRSHLSDCPASPY